MSDNHQADLLARWLDEAGRGETVPDALDSDVVEAVLALRPDLAPAPRVTIDDILDEVEEGPFLGGVAAEAEALAGWLESGELPDEVSVDDDVEEAIFALRPDLAPAPRVSMDDIFGAVTEGPFAAEEPAAAAPVVSLAAARQERAEKKKAWWALPGLGAIAAAAAALLMINPAVMNLPEPTMDLQMEQGPAAPMAAPVAEDEPEVAAERQKSAREQLAADPKPTDETTRLDTRGGEAANAKPQRESAVVNEPAAAAPSAGAAPVTAALEELGYVGPADGMSADADGYAEGGVVSDDPAEPMPEPVEADVVGGDMAPPTESRDALSSSIAQGATGVDANEGVADGEDLDDVLAVEATTESMPTRSRNNRAPIFGRNTKDQPAQAPAAAEEPEMAFDMGDAAADFEEAEEESVRLTDRANDMPALGEGAVLDRLRASAWSLQPVPDISAKYPELAQAYAAADAEWNAGRMDVAVSLLAPFAAHPDPDVVLDVTWHHAQMQYRLGEILKSIQIIEQGLAVSGGDGLLRARLYALLGQLYERRGQPEEAIRAYRMAVEAR